MKKFCFISFIALAVMSCSEIPKTTVGIHIDGTSANVNPLIYTADSTYEVILDSTASATVMLADGFKAGYGSFIYGRVKFPLYMEPGKSFDLSLQIDNRKAIPEFSGEGAKENEYLLAVKIPSLNYKSDEQAFIDTLGIIEATLFSHLDSLGFNSQFVKMEKQRLHYGLYSMLSFYPSAHAYRANSPDYQPSDVYYNYLKELIRENESLVQLAEYKKAMTQWIEQYSVRNLESEAWVYTKAKLDFVNQNINSPELISYLVDKFATVYVTSSSLEHLDDVITIYDGEVTDNKLKTAFHKLCEEWSVLAKGKESPSFVYKNIEGKEISLSDLAGKYIYIDVWATWCGPCRSELPYLKELEEQFKNKDICFVSISCDQNKNAWEKMVKDEKLGGIQLIIDKDDSFMKAYKITGIPRFILLDKEGKIINSKMSRPSNPETANALNALEGI